MFGGAIGGMFSGGIGSIAGGMFGGPIGAMAGSMLQNIGSQVIDQVIEELPLPQPLKDAMQASFHAGMGNFQQAGMNVGEMLEGLSGMLSPMEFAGLEEAIDDLKNAVEDLFNQAQQADEGAGGASGSSDSSDSWLMTIAKALGENLNDKAEDLKDQADALNSDDTKPGDSPEFTAASKEFGMAFEAAITSIKTIGDALNSAARKQ